MSKEYVEREALIEELKRRDFLPVIVKQAINAVPAADVVAVVKCKDCIPAIEYCCYLWDATAWDVFDRITSAYHGKQYYFREGNKVYSRDSGKYLTQQEALDEFVERISE